MKRRSTQLLNTQPLLAPMTAELETRKRNVGPKTQVSPTGSLKNDISPFSFTREETSSCRGKGSSKLRPDENIKITQIHEPSPNLSTVVSTGSRCRKTCEINYSTSWTLRSISAAPRCFTFKQSKKGGNNSW
jgi:hypothetical protein